MDLLMPSTGLLFWMTLVFLIVLLILWKWGFPAVTKMAEADRIIAEAKAEIEMEKQNAIRDIRSQVADLSVRIAEKIVREKLSTNDKQMELIDKLLDEVQTENKAK